MRNAQNIDLALIEPYVRIVYVDVDSTYYIDTEQENSGFDLSKRVRSVSQVIEHDVVLYIDAMQFKEKDISNMHKLTELIDSRFLSKKLFINRFFCNKHDFKIGGIRFVIKELKSTELDLIRR